MAKLGIAGNTSGVISLQGPAIAGTNTLTFPAETGTALTSSTGVPYTVAWNTTVQTSSFTAVADSGYFVNTTSAAVTVTLPSSAARNDKITIVDYAGTAATNNIIIAANGLKINGLSAPPIKITTNRTGLTLTYIDSTQGWLSTSNVYSGNPPFVPVTSVPISYLVVGGGGGGAGYLAGGGGAAGFVTGTTNLTVGTTYTSFVGAGGSGGNAATPSTGQFMGSSSYVSSGGPIFAISTGGGTTTGYRATSNDSGLSGGSGGGGSAGDPGYSVSGGSGTPGQGNAGGNGVAGAPYASGGGGGAGSVGGNGNPSTGAGGVGGTGLSSSITGTPAIHCGGGGGGNYNLYAQPAALGGSGIGGNGGGSDNTYTGQNGVAGTGSGGGGGGYNATPSQTGGAGGSGFVIISIPTIYYTGTVTGSPTVTTNGANTIIKWAAPDGTGTYVA